MEIDTLDEKILEMLRVNSRFTNRAIGLTLKVSEGTVRRRIKMMHEQGVITKFTIEIKDQKEAIVLLRYDFKRKTEVMNSLSKISAVLYEVAGKSDLAMVITYRNLMELNEAIDRIREMSGIRKTETMIRLK